MNKEGLIVRASWVGIVGNSILSIIKIVIGLLSGSMAVVGDGIDSASDIITSIITLYTARMMKRPPNIHYAYGYKKADTVASKVLSFVIFFAGLQLAGSTLMRLFSGDVMEMPNMWAVGATVFSIFGKLFLAYYQMLIGKKTNSAMLKANGKNMQNDVLISFGVLLGLIFTFVFNMPIADVITAALISIYIMYSAVQIFIEANRDLMDGIENVELYDKVVDASSSIEGIYNPHRIRIRKMGDLYLVSLDIEVDPLITVKESHDKAHLLEDKIKEIIPNIYDILIHIEPYGYAHQNEAYGIAARDIRSKQAV